MELILLKVVKQVSISHKIVFQKEIFS